MKSVKRTKKALMAVVVCIMCMISALAFSTKNIYADGDYEVQISLDKEEVHIGDTVKATVKLTGNAGIAGLTMHISYDTNVLEFVSAEATKDVLLSPSVKKDTDATGKVGYSYASEDNAEGTGDILIITFNVKKDAVYGESVLDFAKLDGATSTSETTVSRINIVGQKATLNVVKEECKHTDTTKNDVKEPTCTDDGKYEVTCDNCGETVDEGIIPALGHTFDEYTVIKEATCTEAGQREGICTRCGEKTTENYYAEHVLTQVPANDATVDSEGNIEYFVCSVCNGYFKDAEGKESIDKEDTIIPKLDVNPDDICFNKNNEKAAVYNPYRDIPSYSITLRIDGTRDKNDIKKLKSSKKDIELEAGDGYITVRYGNKSQKTTITCEVKGVKLKTTLKIVKYKNPFKSKKLGGTNYTKRYNKRNYAYITKKYNNNTLSIKCQSGWKITYVGFTKKSTKRYKVYRTNSSTFSKKVSLNAWYKDITIYVENEKTGIKEMFNMDYRG